MWYNSNIRNKDSEPKLQEKMSDYDPELQILREMLAMSILNKLEECGFEETSTVRGTSERVFTRAIPDANIDVNVFTTIVGQEVRSSGKDAIRVCATYNTREGSTKGIVKSTRVHRTGNIEDIVERMYQRMRSTWKSAKTGDCCNSCGAPKFLAKSGNKVCAEICWLSDEEKSANKNQFKRKSRYRKSTRRRY